MVSMIKGIKKFFVKRSNYYVSLFNIFVLGLIAISLTGYVVYLKSSVKTTIFVEASIQRPDWWQTTTHIPSELLSSVKAGDTDIAGGLKVEEMKYFIAREPDWSVAANDKFIGRMQFQVNATKRGQKLYYEEQELLIGNPFVATIGNTRLELLITNLSDHKIVLEYVPRKISVRVYSKYPEQISGIKQGMEIKDNNGFTYAKVLKVEMELSRMTTTDQFGITHKQRDPWKYDLNLEIETLAREENSRIVGYDGRTIAIGKSFVFNSPYFDDIGGWIMDIN